MSYSPSGRTPAEFKWSDLHVGYQASLTHRVTEEDVETFATLTGDFNPVHMDDEFARSANFGRRVVHGMLTSSFISTLVGMLLPGKGALWTSQTLMFARPVFIGDKITVTSAVKQLSPSTQSIVCGVSITNQHGHEVVSGESTVRLLGAEPAPVKDGEPAAASAETAPAPRNGSAVLVTGASGGIGAAAALALAARGSTVLVNYHRNSRAADAVVSEIVNAGGTALAVGGDIADPAAVDAMISASQAFGAVTGLVHCAAPEPTPQTFKDTGWDDFMRQFQTQIGGAYHCIQRLLPVMLEQGRGSVVLLGSIFGDSAPPPQQSAYVSVKAAVGGLARSLASELGPKGVRVNVVSPGMTNTAMIATVPDKARMLAKMNTPLRRLAEPEDIAGVIAFLMSDQAGHITGETIHVSGGVTMG